MKDKKYEPRIIREPVDYDLKHWESVEIKEMKRDLEALESLGATHVSRNYILSYAYGYFERLETEEEVYERKKADYDFELSRLKCAIETIERLQKEFNL